MLKSELLGKIIQCHIDDADPETFVVGQLLYFDSTWFLMADISVNGRYNGFALYMTKDIVSVKDDTDYIQKMKILLNQRGIPCISFLPDAQEPLLSVLQHVNTTSRIVGIETYASGFRNINGFITKVDKRIAFLTQIDDYGRYDGECWLRVDAITRCFFEDEESICLEMLNKYYNSNPDDSK